LNARLPATWEVTRRCAAQLAGKLYGQRFGVDVAFGDPILDAPETVVADDVVASPALRPDDPNLSNRDAYRGEAARVHASAKAANSRVKDQPALALLDSIRSNEAARMRAAIEQTFAFRATHDRPATLRLHHPSGAIRTRRCCG
jgi:hypothetical protein